MFVCFDTKIKNLDMFDRYYASGKEMYDNQQTSIHNSLDKYLKNEMLDGDGISNDWFPTIDSDVFISHSHMDEKYVIAFAGWLKEKFGLQPFIDSCVWGYSNELLREIDNNYCKNDYGNTYNYEKRNVSTSHVHMMFALL